jgi:two-component system phosphate regulon sensor histidine kinase PhoR
VVTKLAKEDAINFLNAKAQVYNKSIAEQRKEALNKLTENHVVLPKKRHLNAREMRLRFFRDSLQRVIQSNKMDLELFNMAQSGELNIRIKYEEFTDETGAVRQRLEPKLIRNPDYHNVYRKPAKIHKYDTVMVEYIDPQFGKQVVPYTQIDPIWLREQNRIKSERKFIEVKKMLETDSLQNLDSGKSSVIENLADEYQKSGEPLKKRISPFWIDSLLRFELHSKGIFLPFNYEVSTFRGDSLIFTGVTSYAAGDPKSVLSEEDSYQVPIFSKEVINDPGKIKVSFPQKNSLILTRMTVTMATTGGLLFVLILCFGYTIFSILRQKKISEMKMDFINNMTHEFKTPVSTIMIASEALRDKELTNDKSRVERLANIIFEENERLGSHIERVLNIARIEKNDFKLDIKPLDVNEMVSTVLDSMGLKLQKYNVKATLNLDATNAVIEADELHFSNVIYNLVDNAIKYSPEAPEIAISTFNRNEQVVIKVADKGIGMNRDQQTKIF